MLHSVVFSVVLLGVIMVATTGRRPLRRTLLGLPLGTLLHLVFSAAWVDTELFWWPVSGLRFDDSRSLFVDRGLLNVPLEVIGLILLWWIYRSADLADPAKRSDFASTGRLTFRVN